MKQRVIRRLLTVKACHKEGQNLHISIPIANTLEFINATEISPLISKCQVKVCYVGQNPNRNGTVITKKVATEMGRKLPGSPVVGYFNQATNDFEGHNKEISLRGGGNIEVLDTTKPYGFVPTDAKVWFQKFDDEGVEREYLVTECYIWTSAYPESQRLFEQGNNQSMELNKETQKGFWAKDNNSGSRFFIYNEALIEKLCILGESVEPCFEGAQFKTEFSLENMEEFRTTMFSMLTELQKTLNKGGSHETMNENKKTLGNPEDPNFEAKKQPEDENKKNPEGNPAPEDNKPKDGDNKPADTGKEEPKKKYNLDEVTEYTELLGKYETLQGEFETLKQEKSDLETEVTSLREFKLTADRKEKQSMIDGFYMLSDDDKKDVVEHIDTYSLDDIEAKLSIICVRNKVNFNLNNNNEQDDNQPKGLFNLENPADDNVPEWIKAVRETAKKL